MKNTTLLSAGSVTAAILASLCCIGPVLVVFLGIGGLATFSIFEAYRPYLLGLTVILISLAFYLTYRKRETRCEDGTCKMESTNKWAKTGVWTIAIVAGFLTAFPYLGLAPQSEVHGSVQSTAEITLKIEGMDCKACAAGIEGSLSSIRGVRAAAVDFQNGRATVEYDGSIVQPPVFVERVNSSGFKATIPK